MEHDAGVAGGSAMMAIRDRYDMLAVAVVDGVLTVTIDRPRKLNAMTPDFWPSLVSLVADAEAERTVRVIVIHGAGDCFSVGGDITSFGALADVPNRREYQLAAMRAFQAWETCAKPTIAAVHGYALGGGCELTMVTDLVVADETAMFGAPEVTVGLIPGLGVVRGRANTNLHWLKRMIFTGEHYDARNALRAGLVTAVLPPGEHLAEAQRLARVVAARPAVALQVAKRILNRGSAEGYDYSIEATALLHGTDDQHEGVAAFRDRRRPEFNDR